MSFHRTPGEPLLLSIGGYSEKLMVMGFGTRADGSKGALERSGMVRMEDVLVAVNSEYVLELPYREVVGRVKAAARDVTLRFVTANHRDRYLETLCPRTKAAAVGGGPVGVEYEYQWMSRCLSVDRSRPTHASE